MRRDNPGNWTTENHFCFRKSGQAPGIESIAMSSSAAPPIENNSLYRNTGVGPAARMPPCNAALLFARRAT